MRQGLSRRANRGAAAVEFALLLPIFAVLLMAPIMIGIWQFHYTAVVKATHDSARYLSSITPQEMREPALAEAAGEVARFIVLTEIEGLMSRGQVNVDIFCGDNRACNGVRAGPLPEFVTVRVELYVVDGYFGFFDTGRYGWPVAYEMSMRYVGR